MLGRTRHGTRDRGDARDAWLQEFSVQEEGWFHSSCALQWPPPSSLPLRNRVTGSAYRCFNSEKPQVGFPRSPSSPVMGAGAWPPSQAHSLLCRVSPGAPGRWCLPLLWFGDRITTPFSIESKGPCIFTKDTPKVPFLLLFLEKFLELTVVLEGLPLCARWDPSLSQQEGDSRGPLGREPHAGDIPRVTTWGLPPTDGEPGGSDTPAGGLHSAGDPKGPHPLWLCWACDYALVSTSPHSSSGRGKESWKELKFTLKMKL